MAKKSGREIIKLRNPETKECYWTVKNKKNTLDKIERKKYSKKLRKHIVFKEAK